MFAGRLFAYVQIRAQWLRDTANQFAHYISLLSIDPQLKTLVKAVINNEARYVSQYPYCLVLYFLLRQTR